MSYSEESKTMLMPGTNILALKMCINRPTTVNNTDIGSQDCADDVQAEQLISKANDVFPASADDAH